MSSYGMFNDIFFSKESEFNRTRFSFITIETQNRVCFIVVFDCVCLIHTGFDK